MGLLICGARRCKAHTCSCSKGILGSSGVAGATFNTDSFTAHWTVNGFLAHADSLATQEEVFNNTFKVIVEFLLQSRRCRHFKDVFI
jgi:hypothetical protein